MQIKPPIKTSSIVRFQRNIKIMLNLEEARMFLIYGPSGIGKTQAIRYYILNQHRQSHSGFPPRLSIVVPAGVTPAGLRETILRALGEADAGQNPLQTSDRIFSALLKRDIKLLLFDEADRLNKDGFDIIREIHDQIRIPIGLVGLETTKKLIKPYEQFNNRVTYRFPFRPLTLDQLIEEFLPKLEFTSWKFDPNNADDRELAEYLYSKVGSSLRWMVSWIEFAAKIATIDQSSRVTLDILKEAAESMELDPTGGSDKESSNDDDTLGYHEMISEMRHSQ